MVSKCYLFFFWGRGLERYSKRLSFFERHISFEIGNGSSVRFWMDRWCDDVELWRSFPNRLNIATEKDCLVSSVLHLVEGRVSWSLTFRRKTCKIGKWNPYCNFVISCSLSTFVTGKTKCFGRDLRAINFR